MVVKENIAAVVERLSAPVVEELGMELVDVEFVKEGGRWMLRVYIDKPGGIGLDDCERVSQSWTKKIPFPRHFTWRFHHPA